MRFFVFLAFFINFTAFSDQSDEKSCDRVASSQVDDCAAKKREASDRKLSEVFSEFKDRTNRLYRADQTLGSALIDLVNKNQDAWSLYRDLTCKIEAFEIEENSLAYVTTVNNCVIHMNDERVVFLKNK